MGFKIKLISLIVGLMFLLFVVRSIRKRSFRPSNSILWLLISLFLISIPMAENFYRWISYSVIGLIDARHIIYIVLIGFLIVYVFYVTIRLNKMSDQIQELITNQAITENKISEKKKLGNNDEKS